MWRLWRTDNCSKSISYCMHNGSEHLSPNRHLSCHMICYGSCTSHVVTTFLSCRVSCICNSSSFCPDFANHPNYNHQDNAKQGARDSLMMSKWNRTSDQTKLCGWHTRKESTITRTRDWQFEISVWDLAVRRPKQMLRNLLTELQYQMMTTEMWTACT